MHEVDGMKLLFDSSAFRFGDGMAATDLPGILETYRVNAPLVVTDKGVEDAGIVDRVLSGVEAPVRRYYATAEPSTSDFADLPTEDVDGVVAIGGGSCIDTAKVAATLLAHGGDAASYMGVGRVPGSIAPLIAIPTTSGTGSQATQTAVVTQDGVKRGISDEHLRPDVSLVDPTLTFGLPRSVTASSGFDAFVHALESLTARDYRWIEPRPISYQGANPISKPLSKQALNMIYGSLERAVFDPEDLEARRTMSLGSHLAGMAFSVAGLGVVHALASTAGGLVDRPHGECLAASVEAGLTYNLPVRRTAYAELARELKVTNATDDTAAASALIEECDRLRTTIELPRSFEEIGIRRSDLDAVVENTLVQERRLETNPRAVTKDLRDHLDAELVP